jgi:hypothetical protein
MASRPGAARTGDDTMTKLNGGTRVEKGYYFDTTGWAMRPVARDGEPLPGPSDRIYFRVPLLAVFAIGPLMGAAFVMFLPFIGFYLVLQAALRPAARLFQRSAAEVAATVQPGWQPGEAHLTGRRAESERASEDGEEGKPPAEDGGLSELEREIAKRRGER